MKPKLLEPFDQWFTVQLPLSYLEYDLSKTDQVKAMQKIRKYYFENNAINGDTLPEYIDLISDIEFEYPIYRAVKEQTARSSGKTYLYK